MKRPRVALTLVLGAMAALAMLDGFPPAERGVAADFSQSAVDPLCPADFPRVCRTFEWFERVELEPIELAPKVLSLSEEEDAAELAALVEQAHCASQVCRFLLEHFSWSYEPIDPDRGLATGFTYGAVEVAAKDDALASVSPLSDVTLGWGGVPVRNWLSECDICLGFNAAEPLAAGGPQVDFRDADDLSTMMAIVRCESYDLAGELNEENQGVMAAEVAAPRGLVEAYSHCEDFELALFPDDWCDECREELNAATSIAAEELREPIDAGPAYQSFGWNGWPLPGDWSSALAADAWQPAETGRCPIVDERETIKFPPPAPQPTPPCGDTAWYLGQQPSVEAPAETTGSNALDAARLSHSLADALARLANLLNAASQEMEDVTERVAREAQREPRSARIPSEHQQRREVQTSEIQWLEI
jgi:hypothetical protein